MKRLAAIVALLSGAAVGQNPMQISGRLVDPTGAVIPRAAVRLRGAAPDETRFLVYTTQSGDFSIPAEPMKKYELIVEADGFATVTKAIQTGPGGEVKLGDLAMQVARSSGVLRDRTFFVSGIAGTSATLSVDDIDALPQHVVKAKDHGTAITFEGVLLSDVLSKVMTPSGEVQLISGPAGVERRGTTTSYYVLATGTDGYQAVFAWAEVDPAFTDKAVYIVTKRDGKPLSDEQGPFRLVAPGEKKAGRWVRQVASLVIRRAD